MSGRASPVRAARSGVVGRPPLLRLAAVASPIPSSDLAACAIRHPVFVPAACRAMIPAAMNGQPESAISNVRGPARLFLRGDR